MPGIAEGFEKYSPKDFQDYLAIARGSAGEVKPQAYIARDLGYFTHQELTEMTGLCNEMGRILAGLRRSLSKKEVSLTDTVLTAPRALRPTDPSAT
jgi:four helix bundle protein